MSKDDFFVIASFDVLQQKRAVKWIDIMLSSAVSFYKIWYSFVLDYRSNTICAMCGAVGYSFIKRGG